jgi:hypothetical protein
MLGAVATLAALGAAPEMGSIFLYAALLGLGYSVTASLSPSPTSAGA